MVFGINLGPIDDVIDYGKGRLDFFKNLGQASNNLLNTGSKLLGSLFNSKIVLIVIVVVGGYIGYRIFLA